MSARVARWITAGILASGVLFAPRPANAHLIFTASPESVLPHASHVVRVTLPTTEGAFTVEKVYRGTLEAGPLTVHGMSRYVDSFLIVTGTSRRPGWAMRQPFKAVAMILALYRMDGRYYVVGEHPAHGVPPHSSVWAISEKGLVHRYQQVTNPGPPQPVPLQHEDFAGHFADLLLAHPFEGYRHRPLPEVERDRFLALVEPTIDWYRQRLADYELKAAARVELAQKLSAYAKTAPESIAQHVLETFVLLSASNHAAQAHQVEVAKLMLAHVKQHGVETFIDAILTALDRQPYGAGDRTILLWVLKETDETLYRKGVAVLRALCLRQMYNEGVNAYRALKQNGETAIVAEIDKAWAAQAARDAAARGEPPPEPATESATEPEADTTPEQHATQAEVEPTPRLTARIETGEPAPPAEPRPSPPGPSPAKDVSLLILIGGLALVGALTWLVIRRR